MGYGEWRGVYGVWKDPFSRLCANLLAEVAKTKPTKKRARKRAGAKKS